MFRCLHYCVTSLIFFICFLSFFGASFSESELESSEKHSIEGKVFPPDNVPGSSWRTETRVLVNGGEYLGFIREDGSFVIHNVPSGSYVVEIINPNYVYESVRVEINSKGKLRARKVNYIQPAQVTQHPYPLRLKPLSRYNYFHIREQWRLTDIIFNPMILMMVLPLGLVMILPKLMNDPETRKEMEQLNNNMKYEMPEVSEVLTTWLYGGGDKQKNRAIKQNKKRQ